MFSSAASPLELTQPWLSANWFLGVLSVIVVLVTAVLVGRIPLRYNIRNLIVRWPTTAMTGLAFVMVIALLSVMLAFVKGMYRLTEASGHPGNIILLSAGTTDEAFSNLAFSDSGDIENQPGIKRNEANQPLCSKETYVVVNQPIMNPRPGGPQRRFLQMRGVDDPLISSTVHGVDLHGGGQWFSPAGVRAAPEGNGEQRPLIEAVIGEGVARSLGRDPEGQKLASVRRLGRLDVGDVMSIGGRDMLVVGVMKSAGSTFDSEIWALRSLIGPLYGKTTYTSLVVRAENVPTARTLRDYFNDEFKKAALQAQLETDYFSNLQGTNAQFLYAVVFIAIVMAIGGVFGVTNTMLAAVAQRSKDIGVLRILGYARWQVLTCFLIESLFIALIGGLIGCGIGFLADGWTATSIVGSGQGGGKSVVLKLVVDADGVFKCLALSLAMGFIGGLYPAITTLRLRPLETLR